MGVSLRSAAATSVSIFRAEPNPAIHHIWKDSIRYLYRSTWIDGWVNGLKHDQNLLALVGVRDGRTKAGELANADEELTFCGGCI